MPPFLNAVAVSSSARKVTSSKLAVMWVPWTVTLALIFFSKTNGNAVRARTVVSASRNSHDLQLSVPGDAGSIVST